MSERVLMSWKMNLKLSHVLSSQVRHKTQIWEVSVHKQWLRKDEQENVSVVAELMSMEQQQTEDHCGDYGIKHHAHHLIADLGSPRPHDLPAQTEEMFQDWRFFSNEPEALKYLSQAERWAERQILSPAEMIAASLESTSLVGQMKEER